LQAGPGTQGSAGRPGTVPPAGPPTAGPAGGGQAGTGGGSLNAGSGITNGLRKQSPILPVTFRKQSLATQPSPAEPGNAKVVVVGLGANRHCPVGSIAGSRSWLHPQATAAINAIAARSNRKYGRVRRRFAVGQAAWVIDPSWRPSV